MRETGGMTAHAKVPEDPSDGDRWTCPDCGVAYVYVVLDDGYAEWVSV